MNLNNIAKLINSGVSYSQIPIHKKRLESFMNRGYIHSTENMGDDRVGIIWVILILIFDRIASFWLSHTFLRKAYKKYYQDSIHTKKVIFKEGFELYDFPLMVPVILSLIGQRHYVYVSSDGEFEYASESDVFAMITQQEATGEAFDGTFVFDIAKMLWDVGIKVTWYSAPSHRRIAKAFAEFRIWYIFGGVYTLKKEYFTNLNQLWDTISNIARVPNRTVTLRSNDKGSVTHITITTKEELQ